MRRAQFRLALSGGVFQDTLLLGRTVSRLQARGFTVLVHSRIPCSDGGISLGQAVVAAARDRVAVPGSSAPVVPPAPPVNFAHRP